MADVDNSTPVAHDAPCVAQNANPMFPDAPYVCCCLASEGKKRGKGKAKSKTKAGIGGGNKSSKVPHPCHGATLDTVEAPTEHYLVRKLFKPSTTQLAAYAKSQKHSVPQKRDVDDETGETTERDTFDDEALRSLRVKYKKDPLYPLIEGARTLTKVKGSYIDKMKPGSPFLDADGYLHDPDRHTPKTLRLASGLLKTMPRQVAPDEDASPYEHYYNYPRQCIVPRPGHELLAADFSAIEPLLVAYLAAQMVDPTAVAYLRACRLNSHSWITSHVVGHPVDMLGGSSDEDVLGQLSDLAKGGPYKVNGKLLPWKQLRTGTKKVHMTSLYAGGPGEVARSNPDLFKDTKEARYLQDAFFEMVPIVPKWHWAVARLCEQQQYLTAPSGFRLWGYDLISTRWSKTEQRWVERLTRSAKEIIAAVPQHCGMMYTATATLALDRERPDLAQWLRLLIHDEVFCEVPVDAAEELLTVLTAIMQRPHPLMPLWAEAQAVMGGASHLSVAVEHKRSAESWGAMA